MTISTTTIKNSYSGNGSTTTFNYTFKITDQDDLEVIIRASTGTETVKTITTHYTVTGVGNAGGGTVVFTAGNIPITGETIVIRRATPQTQATDYLANDPFPAESHEDALDKLTSITQELQEEVDRSIKLSRTNTMTSTEFTVGASDRANKILAFDGSGEIQVTQELGTYQGDWSASTTYYVRDLVKDTSTNNIFICNAQHTSSGSQPLTTNTDSAKWDLIVDAASATSSATAAAASATAAAASATAAASSASAAATSESNASTSETNAATSASTATTQASNAAASASAASTSETNAATSETNAATSATSAASSATSANSSEASALTYRNEASTFATASSQSATSSATSASNASTSENNAQTYASNALTYSNNASTSATNAAASETAAAGSASAAAATFDLFDDSYLGAKASNPTLDNDGNALTDGALYFDTTNNVMKVYDLGTTTWFQLTPTVSNQNNINAVNSNSVNINAVANDATDIGIVATDLTGSDNIGTVATDIANVNLVGGSIANVNQVGSNIGTVNEFGQRYRVGTADPTTSLNEGDLAYNSSANALKYYNGSAWITIVAGSLTDIVQDGTPQLGGTLGLNSNDITGTGNINITGDITATNLSGAGANLTALNGSNIATGTVANARLVGSGAITINGTAVSLGGSATIGTTWESKSSHFNAVSGKAYFVDSSAMALTATLPSSPSIGDEIRFLDATGSFGTYYFTVMRNTNNIQGVADDLVVSTSRAGFALVFYDTTEGWLLKDK